jgi:hypothetical protein
MDRQNMRARADDFTLTKPSKFGTLTGEPAFIATLVEQAAGVTLNEGQKHDLLKLVSELPENSTLVSLHSALREHASLTPLVEPLEPFLAAYADALG